MKPLKSHPFANLLPMMGASDYAALKADVVANGKFNDPAMSFEGKLLDGRNRQKVSEETGIKLPVVAFKGTKADAIRYVYSKAIHRHLNDGQKALAALNFLPVLADAASERMIKGAPVREGDPKGKASKFAGGLFGVSARYVEAAKYVREHDADLFQQVFDGGLPLTRAVRECRRNAKSKELNRLARSVGQTFDASSVQVVTGDCIALAERYPAGKARLIFCDPQYNIGYDYGRKIADALPDEEYLATTEAWMREAHRLLTPDGSLWVLISDEYAAECGVLLKRTGFTRRNWIVWYESFGVNCAEKFNRTKRHLFYCTKHPTDFVFNGCAVTRDSDRKVKYRDARAANGGKTWDDVWGINPPIPRLVENDAERIKDFKTQLPLKLLRPIVGCASEPGDLVMDFFSGSGTTAVACLESHRRFIGFELDSVFSEQSRVRIRAAAGGKSNNRKQ